VFLTEFTSTYSVAVFVF